MNKIGFLLLSIISGNSFSLPQDVNQPIEIKADAVLIDERLGLSTYTGDAEIKRGSLVLRGKNIVVFNKHKQLNKIIAKGSSKKLSHYQQKTTKKGLMKASAINITYDIKKQFIYLKGKAQLLQGTDFFSADSLDYDIVKDELLFKKSKSGKDKVRFKIKL